MNFIFLITSIILISSFVGTVFALNVDKEYTQEEIDGLKNKAVLLQTYDGTILIELFPEVAPNTVENFLNLVDSGYYDGVVFHRIIPGFMIQAGDPNTKDPDSDRNSWGQGGPGYAVTEEFNNIKHVRGIVSMARGQDINSAGSQFFIVHKNALFLDGQYTAFGRVVPGFGSLKTVDLIAELETNRSDAPKDLTSATILEAKVLDPYTSPGLDDVMTNDAYLKQQKSGGGNIFEYHNSLNQASFHLPYRWTMMDNSKDVIDVVITPEAGEHNAQMVADKGKFIPMVLVGSEKRSVSEIQNDETSAGFFSIKTGDDPEILHNYIIANDDNRKAHVMVTTQNLETQDGPIQFKILQIHFNNEQNNYSISYVGVKEFFRYEVNAFEQVVNNFRYEINGELQLTGFGSNPVFKQILSDAKQPPEPESPPPARIGEGCLIATAAFGSELAPQVQLLREIRDNTVLQTQSGLAFMNGFNQFYYLFSPTVADYERENIAFKESVKLILTPLLASLTLLQYVDINSEYEMLGYGIGVILLNIGMYFIAPAILITKIRSFYKLQ